MKPITAIIIDDEQSACDILSQLLVRFCENVEVIDVQNNLPAGVKSINLKKPDVVFLDIQMPKYAGFEIVDFFTKIDFELIFVTAYDNFAVKAFELSAVDYLLKPIEISKLKTAVNRLKERLNQNTILTDYESLIDNLKQKKLTQIVIPHKGDQKVIRIGSIIAIEANEAYSLIHTETDHYLVSKNLKHFETMLSDVPSFFRSHKSWLININYLTSFSKSKNEIVLNGKKIAKLSKIKKNEFENYLTKK